jgi:predicted O-methyltransferase YrrM
MLALMETIIPVKSQITAEPVARYVTENISPDSPLEHRLRLETLKLSNGGMISPPDVGALLTMLAQSVGARRAIEVGTFTGYTALKVAQALPSDGRLICCDINSDWPQIGRRYWREAGVEARIDLRVAPALETLNSLLKQGGAGSIDFVFIDADKKGYESYYEVCLQLVRPGGLIVLDNMLWDGAVANPGDRDEITEVLRGLNTKISRDSRVSSVLLTVGDGLMVARKN